MMAFKTTTTILISLFLLSSPVSAVETVGKTYEISEQDALIEIQERAARAQWSALIGRDPKTWTAFKTVSLPAASMTTTRHYQPLYRSEFDVPDANGKILYPKGYEVNPLDYLTLPGRIVIIREQEQQMQWAKEGIKDGDLIIVAGGDVGEVGRQLKRPAFVLEDRVVKRLSLRATPTILKQVKNQFEITEYALSN